MIFTRHPDDPKFTVPGRKFIGYWKPPRGPNLKNLPDPSSFIDPDMEQDFADKTARVLEMGATFVQWRGPSSCRICGVRNEAKCLTFDGTWVWPEGLAHYVQAHRVRLHSDFIFYLMQIPEEVGAEVLLHRATMQEIWESRESRSALDHIRLRGREINRHREAVMSHAKIPWDVA